MSLYPAAPAPPLVSFRLEDGPDGALKAPADQPLAVALFARGIEVLSRSIKFHRPRGLFCLSGDCGACLMRIDGVPNQKACQVRVHEGLTASRQNAWPSASIDLFAAADLFFQDGMDHHTLLTAPRPLNALLQTAVHKLGGLGLLPDPAATPAFDDLPRGSVRHVDVAVVGAGPAGLAAATTLGRAGLQVICTEGRLRPGGSYLSHPDFGPEAAADAVARALAAGVEILCPAQAIGWYAEDTAPGRAAPGLLAVVTPTGLLKLTARRYVYAPGAHEQNALFEDNDRPGVIAGRAAGLLLRTYGVVPGRRPAVLGDSPYARRLCAALTAAGAEVLHLDAARQRVVRARPASLTDPRVGSLEIDDGAGPRTVPCDLVAVCVPPAPATAILRQHGAAVDPEQGFAAVADEAGLTRGGAYVAGDAAGFMDVAQAALHGATVGAAVAAAVRAEESP